MKPSTNQSYIVITSTNRKFHHRLNSLLVKEECNVIHTQNIKQSIQAVSDNDTSIVMIDTCLLEQELKDCLQLRKVFASPIAVISCDEFEVFDEAQLLDYGADTYIDGSRSDALLLANIAALTRRKVNAYKNDNIISIQDLDINLKTFEVYQQQRLLKLTYGEFQLLSILVKQAGNTIKKQDLLQALTHTTTPIQSRSLDLRISLLRKKLGDTQLPHKYIITVRGKGYMFLSAPVQS